MSFCFRSSRRVGEIVRLTLLFFVSQVHQASHLRSSSKQGRHVAARYHEGSCQSRFVSFPRSKLILPRASTDSFDALPFPDYANKQAHVELAARMKIRDAGQSTGLPSTRFSSDLSPNLTRLLFLLSLGSAPALGDRVAYVIIKGIKGLFAHVSLLPCSRSNSTDAHPPRLALLSPLQVPPLTTSPKTPSTSSRTTFPSTPPTTSRTNSPNPS